MRQPSEKRAFSAVAVSERCREKAGSVSARSKSMSLATTANVLPDFLLLLHASGGVGDDIVRKQ